MAIVKEIEKKITSHDYVYDSISYILSPEDSSGKEKCFKSSCINCFGSSADDFSKQFYIIRNDFHKDSNILAHHYVQSFSPDENISPETAHQIGIELAQKVAPRFQVIVATHTDKEHLHNHIIINSVSMETGLKWKADLKTRNNMRNESDKLCKLYGLDIIDNPSGLRSIDQTTLELARQGRSWKADLCRVLDEAIIICCRKKEFIDFMKRKNFEITQYTDRHITFQKIGETKKIRADTLAKQFGNKYTKENLEKKMGYYHRTLKIPYQKKTSEPFISEFEKYEKNHFMKNPPPVTTDKSTELQERIKASKNPFFLLLVIIRKFMFRKKLKASLDNKYEYFHLRAKKQKRYKTKEPDLKQILSRYEKKPLTAGNILYRDLVKAQGENLSIRISLSAVPKLYAYPFFFSAKLYNDYAIITLKKSNKELIKKALKLSNESIIEDHNNYYTPKFNYQELKKRAENLGVKIEFLVISPSEIEMLNNENERFVPIPLKDGKIRLAFLPQNKDFILHALYPDKYTKRKYASGTKNAKVITLKKRSIPFDKSILTKRKIVKDKETQEVKKQVTFIEQTEKEQDEAENIINKPDTSNIVTNKRRRMR